ncbi:MAG TPA: family 16 glycoside hydrolase, partial [Pirellulaceae bacterium]
GTGWYSLYDGTGESVTKYWFNPSGQNHGSNSRWWITGGVLYSDQSADRTGGCIFTKRKFKNAEFKTLIKPYFGNDAGIFLRSNSAGRSYQVVIDFVQGGTKAIGGVWGEARPSGQDINYKPFGFNSASSVTLRSEWYSNGQGGRPSLTAADWNGKIWKLNDFNWVTAKIYNGDVPHIDTWINKDYQMVHYEDPASKAANEVQNGHIALQIHTGSGNWSINNPNQYKAMFVRELQANGQPLASYPEWSAACGTGVGKAAPVNKAPTLDWKISDSKLKIQGDSPEAYSLVVTDMTGKIAYREQGPAGAYTHSLNMPDAGLNLLTIRTKSARQSYSIYQAKR